MVCADRNVRLCFLKLFCWLADHMENITICGISKDCCPRCTVPREKLGEYSNAGYLMRFHQDCRAAYIHSDASSLKANRANNKANVLWSIPGLNPVDLLRADILHHIVLGIFEQMMGRIQEFLEQQEQNHAFDYVWRRLPP